MTKLIPAHARLRPLIALFLGLALVAAACGGDDSAPSEDANGDVAVEVGDSSGGEPGPGEWTSSQLCGLADDHQVTVVMVGLDAPEDIPAEEVSTGCSWPDYDGGRDLLRLEQGVAADLPEGESVVIAGADGGVFVESGLVGEQAQNSLFVIVGDRQLELAYPADAAEGRTLVETIATTWVAVQAGCPGSC